MSCLFFPPVSTSALVSSHMLSYFAKRKKKTETRLKDDAFHRRGLENTKWNLMWMSDELQASPPVTRWRHTVRPPQRLVVVLYDYFFLQHFFFLVCFLLIYECHLPYMCAINAAQCFTFAMVFFCLGEGALMVCTSLALRFGWVFEWFDLTAPKKKRKSEIGELIGSIISKFNLKKKSFFSTTDYER